MSDSPKPKPISTYGNQNKMIAEFLDVRQYILNFLNASNNITELAVASPSMTLTLKMGDLIVVQGLSDLSAIVGSPPEFWHVRAVPPKGTIIVFHKPSNPDELIVHRVASKVDDNGTWFFQTKGDNNP